MISSQTEFSFPCSLKFSSAAQGRRAGHSSPLGLGVRVGRLGVRIKVRVRVRVGRVRVRIKIRVRVGGLGLGLGLARVRFRVRLRWEQG